jgi:hypothetical protein
MKPKKKHGTKKAAATRGKKSTASKPTKKTTARPSAKPPKPSDRTADTRNRAFAALARMRRERISLSEACRLEHIKPATFRRYLGNALRQDKPGGRFFAKSGDTYRRDLQIPTAQGMKVVSMKGSNNARFVATYLNAVGKFLRYGKTEELEAFKGKTVKIDGKEVELLTEPALLWPLAEADLLHLDQLYATATGRG